MTAGTSPTTTTSMASPVSVIPVEAPTSSEMDPISLADDHHPANANNHHSKGNVNSNNICSSTTDHHHEEKKFDDDNEQQQKLSSKPWGVCRASAKALRTQNPIRAIVDPIVATIQSGEERGDGKDLISLAVSRFSLGACIMLNESIH